MATRVISSVDELFRMFGYKDKAVAEILDTTPKNAAMWRLRGRFPPKLYVQHQELLRRVDISAPAALWSQAPEPPKQEGAPA